MGASVECSGEAISSYWFQQYSNMAHSFGSLNFKLTTYWPWLYYFPWDSMICDLPHRSDKCIMPAVVVDTQTHLESWNALCWLLCRLRTFSNRQHIPLLILESWNALYRLQIENVLQQTTYPITYFTLCSPGGGNNACFLSSMHFGYVREGRERMWARLGEMGWESSFYWHAYPGVVIGEKGV
jgi:hypothetical protein